MRMAVSVRRHRLKYGFVALLCAITLAGCTAPATVSSSSPSTSAAPTSSAAPAATPEPTPVLQPEQSAAANLAYFDFLVGPVAASAPEDGRAWVDALVAGGFDKTAMQLTFDRTHVDLAADSVQVSVRFNDECLIGQYGPASGGYHSMVAPLLGTGTCLLGATRQIDW